MLITVNGLPVLLSMDRVLLVEHSTLHRSLLRRTGTARSVARAVGVNLRDSHGLLHLRDAAGQRFTGFFPTTFVSMIIEASRRRCLPPTMDAWDQCRGIFPGWPDDWPHMLGDDPFVLPMPGSAGRCW